MLGLILLAGFATLSVAQFRAIRRFARLRQDLGQAVAEAQKRHEEMATQNALDENVNLLRLSLLALGPPKLAPDGLYFGNRKINGDHTIVDEVRQKFGGAATIFMGDERIATNVESPGGGRAIGTRLAAGPVHDQVFGKKISYRGETNILGEPYVAIYEPIIADGAVIGLIFAGSKKSTAAPPPPLEINAYVALISSITRAQAEAATQAITLRQHADDQRRMLEADRQTLARQQEVALNQLALALRALATGDLTAVLTSKFSGGYESLRNDFNTAITKLQDTLRIVIENSQSVRAGTNDITQGLDDLSGRTEQLAASLEQSSAALAQLNVTVSETAAGASEAQGFVSQTSADALHSIEVLRETVTAMSNIQTSSNQIAGIIGVMDELSFQTNLLALNAGVEAARAGDAGRGFAVVATEVRALAQRSTDAAKEIKNLITVSRDQVTTGVRLVAETTTLLERISTQVQQLDARIKRFANATSDQSMGLQQITEAVNAMDKATQQNAASAEESTAASHQIAAEASALADQMEHFRLTPTPLHQVRTQNAGTRAKNPVFHTV